MPIILSSLLTAREESVRPVANPALPMTWIGVDGSVWALTGPGAVSPRLRPGVQGLHMPPMTIHKSSTPMVPGVDLLGYSLPERRVYWPLMFRSRSVEDWRLRHAGFFDSFDPIETGVWTVGEGAGARSLPLTGRFDGGYSFERDPFMSGRALIGLELEAPRPLWRGQTVSRTFRNAGGLPFIPGGLGPPFYISPGATFSNARIDNLGDEPAYLVWTLLGPLADITFGVGDAIVEVPFDLEAGDVLVVDTDPAGQYATLNGVDCAQELGFQLFGPVPKKGSTPLTITSTGAGSAEIELVPLFWRAF